MDSDDNFMVYRRFGFLHARLLLQKQDELKKIEWELDLMDKCDWEDGEDARVGLRSRDVDEARTLDPGLETRKKLLARAEKLVNEYGKTEIFLFRFAIGKGFPSDIIPFYIFTAICLRRNHREGCSLCLWHAEAVPPAVQSRHFLFPNYRQISLFVS